MKEIKLMNIVIDPELQIREVESNTVAVYSEAMKAGSIFPPIIIDKNSRLICGHHRYHAYKHNFEPDYMIPCEVTKFTKDADLIMLAAGDNSKNGRPLTTFEKKTVSLRLIKTFKIDSERVSEILGVRVERITEWAGMTVCVIGKNGKKRTEKPLKKGYEHLIGKEVTEEDYEQHRRKDYGVTLKALTNQIISILKRDDLWVSDETALIDLQIELTNYFNKKGVK